MRILYIELSNYIGIYNGMGLTKLCIDFSKCKNRVIAIKGDNGTGKSTIYKALNPLGDNSIEYIPGEDAYKIISYILNDGSILTIRYISKMRSTGERAQLKCHIKRKYLNGEEVDLNPSLNITTAKDVIYELFSLDDNFILLSQLSANSKGLGGLKPNDRKRYVNTIVSSLSVYNDMNKMFMKKSNILKSMKDNLATKLSQIGNVESISKTIDINSNQLNVYETKKDRLIQSTATIKAKLDDINKDGDILDRYKQCVEDKKRIEKEYSQLGPIESYSEDELVLYEKEMSKLEGKESTIEEQLNDCLDKLKTLKEEQSKLRIQLESMGSNENIDTIKNRIDELSNKLNQYHQQFIDIGFSQYEDITIDEYNTALEIIDEINNTIRSLGEEYYESIIEESLSYYYNKKFKQSDLTKLLMALNIKTDQIRSEIKDQNTVRNLSSRYNDIPKDCNNINTCPFIRDIVIAQSKRIDDISYDRLVEQLDSMESNIKNTLEKIKSTDKIKDCLSIITNMMDKIKLYKPILSKFPNSNVLYDNHTIDNYITQSITLHIDTNVYRELLNYKTLIEGYKTDIDILQKKYEELRDNSKLREINDKILDYDAKIHDINETKSSLLAQISDIRNDKLQIKSKLDHIRYIKANKSSYEHLSQELKEITDLYEKLSYQASQYEILNKDYVEQSTQLNTLANKEIPLLRDSIEQDKYKMLLFNQYTQEFQDFDKKYNITQQLRYYTSINGIQTIYMEVFMNSILQNANNLLQYLFSGRFTLQPFVINDSEFRIPCIDSEGHVRPDISFMSDSQLSMISMIISFALLNRASKVYNIIKLDEVDNNLDNENRIQFSILIDHIMSILNFEQCFIISHNNELNLSNVDMILFRIDNLDTYSTLLSSGANIIYDYNQGV